MSPLRICAVFLLAAGVFGLVYGGISATRAVLDARIVPREASVRSPQTTGLPVWPGVGAIVLGGALFAAGGDARMRPPLRRAQERALIHSGPARDQTEISPDSKPSAKSGSGVDPRGSRTMARPVAERRSVRSGLENSSQTL